MKKLVPFLSLFLFLSPFLFAKSNLIHIPKDFSTIQSGIDHALNGDTVLVSPGTYNENINFKGKNIVVTSNYILSGSVNDIKNTIIDGSHAINPDSASCVFFSSKEDSTATIQGFTLTKGKGTRYLYSNGWFREGGGVFVEKSSPTIKNNLIVGNEVLNANNVTSAGGGAIRSNLGNPHIYNNYITLNKALFGAAIVLDNSNGTVKNNIIYLNTGASSYSGGGAFWIYGPGCSVQIENNTIVANSIGGLFFQAIKASISNNIVWGNENYQISFSNGFGNSTLDIKNNVIQGGYAGNIGLYPSFTDTSFFTEPASPSIDAGSEGVSDKDIEDPLNPGFALFPSQGGIRNDIGAYGGPTASSLPSPGFFSFNLNPVTFGNNNTVGTAVSKIVKITNQSTFSLKIDSISFNANSQFVIKSLTAGQLKPIQTDSVKIEWTPQNEGQIKDSILIYHGNKAISNPLKIPVSGRAKNPTSFTVFETTSLISICPNPFKESATIQYRGVKPDSKLVIYSSNGKVIRSISVVNGEGSINLMRNGMLPGVYIYSFESENSLKNGRFVIID
jgi:hypothetical protein